MGYRENTIFLLKLEKIAYAFILKGVSIGSGLPSVTDNVSDV